MTEHSILERPATSRFAAISSPCPQAIALVARVLGANPAPVIAEIGVGIGATSIELCRLLDHRGEAWFFDFEDRLAVLESELRGAGFRNIRMLGNARKSFGSYSWTLAMLRRQTQLRHPDGLFDFIYLDGAHVFHHDAAATLLCKQLLKPGGILLFDDYDWSIAVSPTIRPSVFPAIAEHYTEEQIETPHVKLICDLFMDDDPDFSMLDIGYGAQEHRRAYRRMSRA